MSDHAIEVRDLWMTFPGKRKGEQVHVLENVNLSVKRGEFVCIVGPSGCGKSTLLNIIGGFLQQTSGSVLVEGKPVTGPDPKRIFVFQENGVFPWLTVQAAIVLGHLHVDLGDRAAAARMLADARRHVVTLADAGVLPTWIDHLAATIEDASARSRAKETTTLTAAELGVLRLLPTHLSLAQIADQHVVSRNTVKTQVASIYRKLGVNDRTEAVDRARAQGLLEAPPTADDRLSHLG